MTTNKSNAGLFLFSVDVEDFPVILEGKETYAGRVPELIGRYLAFLRDHQMKATFFVLGEVAERSPGVVRMILDEGHEVGSHGYSHLPLDKHTPATFREDLARSLTALRAAGAAQVVGYRAPFLSLVPKTAWAYPILAELGFKYSSSVLPRYNPLYGWPGFGEGDRVQHGVREFPVTLIPGIPIGVPVAGGVYFRIAPFRIMLGLLRRLFARNEPVLSYFHPYDLDWDSESKVCAWLAKKPLGNFLIFYNRKSLISRLNQVVISGARIITYREFATGVIDSTKQLKTAPMSTG